MTGDTTDMAARIRSVLPTRWFPDETPVLDALLSGLGSGWSTLYAALAFVRAQSRLATASGCSVDAFSVDFFGARLPRRLAEADSAYRGRISAALVQEHATRQALSSVLEGLTGRIPTIFEPARPADTGSYSGPALGYSAAGAWGNLSLPFQVFVEAYRPPPPGIANVAGYGTAGPLARASLAESGGQVSDTDIYAAIKSVLPTATTAWTRISN